MKLDIAIVITNRLGCELYRRTIEKTDNISAAIAEIMAYFVVYEGDTISVVEV